MFKLLLGVLFTSVCFAGSAQQLYFPPLTGNVWETTDPSSLGWCEDSLQTLIDYVGSNNSKAFIILKDGKIVTENYYGTFTQDSLWYWASAGKSLTAFLIGMAQEEGLLDINNLSSQYIGTGWTLAPAEKESLITVRSQLTMTSGLDDGTGDADCTDDTCLIYLADAGTRWAYHNAPYTLLDEVIQGASGGSINQFYGSRMRQRIGMGTSLYVPLEYNNVMFSTARSFARFGLLMLNHGVWGQDTLLHDQDYYQAMINTSQTINESYGYLWWLNGKNSFMYPQTQTVFPGPLMPEAPDDMFCALGKNGQYINVVPEMNLVLIRMGDAPAGVAGLVPTVLDNEIWRRLNGVFCGTVGINKRLSGRHIFPNPSDDIITVSMDGNESVISIELLDLAGKSLMKNTGNRISTSNVSNGIYIIDVRLANGNRFMEKIIVAK